MNSRSSAPDRLFRLSQHRERSVSTHRIPLNPLISHDMHTPPSTPRSVSTRSVLVLLVLLLAAPTALKAQLAIGGGFELRDADPKSGLNVHIENHLLKRVPVINLRLRLHASLFSDDINVQSVEGFDVSNLDIRSNQNFYDYGIAMLLGLNLGLANPYVGAGLGSENYKIKFNVTDGIPDPDLTLQDLNDQGFYFNGFIGAEVAPIPFLKPYFEYRFSQFLTDEQIDYESNGRIAIGLRLVF